MALYLAHDAFRRHIEPVAPHRLRPVVYELVRHGDAPDIRLYEIVVLVEELDDGVAETAGQRALLDRQDAREVRAQVRHQLLVNRLGEASVDDRRLYPLPGQYFGGSQGRVQR